MMFTFRANYRPTRFLVDQRICRTAFIDLSRIHKAESYFESGALELKAILDYAEGLSKRWMRVVDSLTVGIILMHLGDLMLSLQEIDRARTYYRYAVTRFYVQVDTRYRQNEAAALYGLALVAWFSKNQGLALHRLNKALRLLKKTEHNWISIYTDSDNADFCRWAQALIRTVRRHVVIPALLSPPIEELSFNYGRFKRIGSNKIAPDANSSLILSGSNGKS
jgi:tetratricopeptide (TPR) repeat protein